MNSDTSILTIIEQIKEDYGHFPHHQTYSLYAADVFFQDPMNSFHGIARYQRMIGFINQWFRNIDLELHGVEQPDHRTIITRWTLHFTAPTPWQPQIAIPGWSQLEVNADGLINSHIDHWNCSRWDVVKQLFSA